MSFVDFSADSDNCIGKSAPSSLTAHISGVEKGTLVYVLDGEFKGKMGFLTEADDTAALVDLDAIGLHWLKKELLVKLVILIHSSK